MARTQGQRIGPWVLGERLGRGGNAEVWRATAGADDDAVALKVINVNRVEREPYQRFVREIEFLRRHHSVEGVLPLIDAHLPDVPTTSDRPWLAMPIATPIGDALQGRPLGDVVAAVSTIADTLWRLATDHGIAHRDIKPGNLYELDGRWLLGDFGLVALPDTTGLTVQGRPLGPAHYTAYEMMRDPSSADPHAADVYSLGKTLWVLATDQRFPPEGHQPSGTRGFEIGDFRSHPRAAALDLEVDLMTRLHPEERPSKEQVARDLAAWSDLDQQPVVVDVSEAKARLRRKLDQHLAGQDTLEHRKELAYAAVRTLQELTSPLNEALKSLYGRTQVDSASDKLTQNLVRSGSRRHVIEFRWQRCTLVAPLDRPGSMALRMSRCLELDENGLLHLHLLVLVAREGVMGGGGFNWDGGERSAPVGTIEATEMLQEGVRELAVAVSEAVDVFVDALPDPDEL